MWMVLWGAWLERGWWVSLHVLLFLHCASSSFMINSSFHACSSHLYEHTYIHNHACIPTSPSSMSFISLPCLNSPLCQRYAKPVVLKVILKQK